MTTLVHEQQILDEHLLEQALDQVARSRLPAHLRTAFVSLLAEPDFLRPIRALMQDRELAGVVREVLARERELLRGSVAA